MNKPNTTAIMRARHFGSHLALGIACASLSSACSGQYPLGEVSSGEQLLESDDRVTGAALGDAQLSAVLASADITLAASYYDGAGTVSPAGDLDADGYGDMAVSGYDIATGVAFVHVRYGGPRPRNAQQVFAFDGSGARLTLVRGSISSLAVGAAGDVDGDGYGDLLVRTQECGTTQPETGTYLVYGGAERLSGTLSLASAAAHFPAPSEVTSSGCNGYAVAAAPGDLDGDGFDDLAIGIAPELSESGAPALGTGEGIYIFYGRAQRFAGVVQLAEADASLVVSQEADPVPVGDVNGDGFADLLVRLDFGPGSYVVPGSAARLSGQLDLTTHARLIANSYSELIHQPQNTSDVDGDGISDLVLRNAELVQFLFYGAPGLLDGDLDVTQADVTFTASHVLPIGDLDADGDDELLDLFEVPDGPVTGFSKDVAILGGSRARLSGSASFPESEVLARTPGGRFPDDPTRAMWTPPIPAGDLDGDGAEDLFSISEAFEGDGRSFSTSAQRLHIHYGIPVDWVEQPR